MENKPIVAKKVSEETWKNTIWDDGEYYILEHTPTGEKAYFDRTDEALRAVQRKIKRCGSVVLQPTGPFAFKPAKGKSTDLSQLLYAVYNSRPLSWVRKGRTSFLNGDYHDLTSGNLTHSLADTSGNVNRQIYVMGDYIFLRHSKSGRTYFCKKDPELYELLCDHHISWYYAKANKLQANIVRGGKIVDDLKPYFHQLVFAFEHYGARCNNFIGRIRQMQRDFEKASLTIDHLDGTQENAMPWNLSTMTQAQNSAKKDLLDRVRYPFFLFAVYFEEKYRIYCGRILEPIVGALDYNLWICETPDDLIDCVRAFLSCEWEDGLSPAKNFKKNPDTVCFQNYFGDFGASGIREELMKKPVEDFAVWKVTANSPQK